ncbi:MAG: hypothetical protein QM762_07750 [Chryseolinea sp.]
MVSRITDDYETLAKMGCVAMSEPAFWAGFDRGSVDGFRDYFRQLTEFEPKRAGWYGMQHFTWLCINAKEAENVKPFARSDRDDPRVPRTAPACSASARSGSTKTPRTNRSSSWSTWNWRSSTNEQILIHTPHLEDKYQGTRMILDMLMRRRAARS